MANSLDLEATVNKARRLLEERISAVEKHKLNVDAEQAARRELEARERDSAASWAELLTAGWTSSELTRMGFKEPTVKPVKRGRPRKADSTAAPTPSVPPQSSGTSPASPTPAPSSAP